MIKYQLKCSAGHQYEAWFRDAAAFDRQSESGEVECPLCGDTDVTKAPMAPRLGKGARRPEAVEQQARDVADQIFQTVEKLRRHVEESCDYVGERFPEEARRIHYGETEKRGIYGEATDEEAHELKEEGIEFQRLRWLPRRND
jgi:hypothetical protein